MAGIDDSVAVVGPIGVNVEPSHFIPDLVVDPFPVTIDIDSMG